MHHNKRPPIRWIEGQEPNREGEFPLRYAVGDIHETRRITEIKFHETGYGEHGIVEYLVYVDNAELMAAFNARYVSVVRYG